MRFEWLMYQQELAADGKGLPNMDEDDVLHYVTKGDITKQSEVVKMKRSEIYLWFAKQQNKNFCEWLMQKNKESQTTKTIK